jgi:DNA processing protein
MNRKHIVTPGAKHYPRDLVRAMGFKGPQCLHCRGNLNLLNGQGIGFSGSRKASLKGLEVAKAYATRFARQGWTVTSGYANGVDLAAHRAALAAGGTTVVVLPHGIDQFRVRPELGDVWDWNRAVVVSQFEPEALFKPYRAIQRNALIAGLSQAVLVFEAGYLGGTLNTGLTTLSLGIPLFAPLYPELPPTARGNQLLIARGARSLEWGTRSVAKQVDWIEEVVVQKLTA